MLSLFLLLAFAVDWGVPSLAAPPPPESGPRLLEAGPTGIALEWTALPVRVRVVGEPQRRRGHGGFTEIPYETLCPLRLCGKTLEVIAEGYDRTEIPGAPRLPYTTTLIALPPGVSPSLHVEVLEESTLPLPGPLAIAPAPDGVVRDDEGRPVGPAFAPAAERLPAPASPVALEEVGIVRTVRLARLTFYPALPEEGRLRLYRRVRVEVAWSADHVTEATAPPAADPLLTQVRRAVLNPWGISPTSSLPRFLASSTTTFTLPIAFLEIDAPGLYRLTYTDLAPLGFGTVDPHNFHLFRGDDEVAYEWGGDDDAAFEPGESILFYAEPRFSRWTRVDVYRLVADGTPGLWMGDRSADPTGLSTSAAWVEEVFEENRLYTPDRFTAGVPPGRDGDRWVWDYLVGPASAPTDYSFSLAAVDATSPATLTLWLIGYTAGDHRWAVGINGAGIGEVTWAGQTAVTQTLRIPPGMLRSGGNVLSLRPRVTEGAWLDGFAVRYGRSAEPAGTSVAFGMVISPSVGVSPPPLPYQIYLPLVLHSAPGAGPAQAHAVALDAPGPYRAYDVSDPLRPVRLTGFQVDGQRITLGDPPEGPGHRYFVTAESGVQSPDCIRPPGDLVVDGGTGGADLLVITHPDFAEAIGPLVDLRRNQGLAVTVVNVLGIYDAYGDGRPDPEAIRVFIADAYGTWSPRPTYVLLVGDGSFDPRQYRPESPPTFIPPYLADVDPWAGETAADNRYACVDGNDNLPDLLLGRLPVGSPEEATAVVEKIVAYETDPLPGGWNAGVVLVADDADSAGDFAAASDDYAAVYVTDPFTVTRRYCPGSDPYLNDCPAEETSAVHERLLSDWSRGALLIQFTGHSSWHQWAVERLLHLDDLAGLHNDRRWPVVVEMTCFTGAFHRPEPTLDEELVLLSDGGAVTAWGPTGLGVGTGHSRLSDGFFRAVFVDGVEAVGEAVLAGKLNLAATGQNLDLLDTFTLLGDPALRLNRTLVPWTQQTFFPLITRGDIH